MNGYFVIATHGNINKDIYPIHYDQLKKKCSSAGLQTQNWVAFSKWHPSPPSKKMEMNGKEICTTFYLPGALQESSSILAKSFTGSLRSGTWNENTSVAVKTYLYKKDMSDALFILQHFIPLLCSLQHIPQLIPWLGYQLVTEKNMLKIVTKKEEEEMTNLDHFLYKKNQRIEDPKVILQIVLDIAIALQHLHQHGIIYSCLRPCYVYLYKNGTRAKLSLDLTHLTPSSAASPSSSLHHLPTISHLQIPSYQSPESFQCNQTEWTNKVDVYALGVLMNELLSKAIPWHNTPTDKVRVRVCDEKARPPISSTVNKEIVHLIEHCWEQAAEHRPTMEQVIHELNTLLLLT